MSLRGLRKGHASVKFSTGRTPLATEAVNASAVHDRIGFDLDQEFRCDEPRYFDARGDGVYPFERLRVRTCEVFEEIYVSHERPRSHYVFERRAAFDERTIDLAEDEARLLVHIDGADHVAIWTDGYRSRNVDELTATLGAAVGDLFFPWRAGVNVLMHMIFLTVSGRI